MNIEDAVVKIMLRIIKITYKQQEKNARCREVCLILSPSESNISH